MTSRTRLAALRILALREEFNVKELRDALSLAGEWSVILGSRIQRSSTSPSMERASKPPLSTSQSRVVKKLQNRDPKRYLILSKVDHAVRVGDILPRLSDIQRAGFSLDKGFGNGKSKRVAIPRLMASLTALPVEEIERLYESWKREMRSERRPNAEYDDLAEFLITGTTTRSPVSMD